MMRQIIWKTFLILILSFSCKGQEISLSDRILNKIVHSDSYFNAFGTNHPVIIDTFNFFNPSTILLNNDKNLTVYWKNSKDFARIDRFYVSSILIVSDMILVSFFHPSSGSAASFYIRIQGKKISVVKVKKYDI